ncbi:MAG: hypothetical protein GXX91_14500 [Verrucomicrobiaceae bacterium]|nr:hypothetical protein [Verrucomicrobiaceae bacterium]
MSTAYTYDAEGRPTKVH